MISLLLVALAAICNAVMDVISFHYKQSIFTKFNPQWWNPAISWKNKYVSYDKFSEYTGSVSKLEKRIFILNLFSIKYPTFLTDAWHFFKSLMIVLLGFAIELYNPVVNIYVDIILVGLAWNLTFNVFYNKIFKKH